MNKSLLVVLFIVLGLTFAMLNLLFGSESLSVSEVFSALTDPNHEWYSVLYNIRLPKMITAILVGSSLPVAGMLLQTLFQNPIASPSILGISSMAGLGTALLIFVSEFFIAGGIITNSWIIVLFSALGAIFGLFLISMISYKINNNASILVIGLILASLSSAIISTLQYFSSSDKIKDYFMWTLGSFEGLSWNQIGVFFIVIVLCLIFCVLILKQLNVLHLGESYAETSGVQVGSLRIITIVISGLLTAVVTSFVGPIAFLGLIIPHISRLLFKTTNHNWLLPANILIGIAFTLLINLSSTFFTVALPINIITSFIGAPLAIFIIVKQSKFM
ncbi:vitamin B12 import system permease protein BtuC [Flavobacteriaceae bacterium UJ101]|nr:vitamin B12 import system permease protein BtuC [Flavobacteriaceae bacterium UJ101]